MKQTKQLFTLALLLTAVVAMAESGPFVPSCTDCPEFVNPPYPQAALWYNPQRPGTGINIDVQNGILAAMYYGYRDDGSAIWYQFSGHLARSESDDVYWELEADLIETSNGEPVNGPYQFPDLVVAGTVHVEIMQRNLLRFTIDGGPSQRMVPMVFGSDVTRPFPEKSDVVFPTFGEGDGSPLAPWHIIQISPNGNAYSDWISNWGEFNVAGHTDLVFYRFYDLTTDISSNQNAEIACGTGDDLQAFYSGTSHDLSGTELRCIVWIAPDTSSVPGPNGGRVYYMPLGNMGDRRFAATSDDGWTIEGFRLMYD